MDEKEQAADPPGFPDFDPKNLSPQERDVANTVLRCLFESIAVSTGSGYIAFRQTGNYISTKGTPTMKSWGSVIKFGVGFFAFSLVRSMYGKGVCLPRVKNLPPSPIKDQVLKIFDQSATEAGFNREEMRPLSAPNTVDPRSVPTEAKQIEADEELIDYKTHETDVSRNSFDADKNTHRSHKGQDFDYSKSYSLPPAEAPSKVVRRNKYGDIIEDHA